MTLYIVLKKNRSQNNLNMYFELQNYCRIACGHDHNNDFENWSDCTKVLKELEDNLVKKNENNNKTDNILRAKEIHKTKLLSLLKTVVTRDICLHINKECILNIIKIIFEEVGKQIGFHDFIVSIISQNDMRTLIPTLEV